MGIRARLKESIAKIAELVEKLKMTEEGKATSDRRLDNAVRAIFLLGDALSPIVGGELGMLRPTTDMKGVTIANDQVIVTISPSTETITITGNQTMHRLELVTPSFVLTKEQRVQIIATVTAIKAVRGHRPDPLAGDEDINLLGTSGVMTGA